MVTKEDRMKILLSALLFLAPAICASAPPTSNYAAARYHAIEYGVPLIVAVNCEPPKGTSWTTCRETSWHWGSGSFLVVASPADGQLWWRADLPANASVSDIMRAIDAAEVNAGVFGGKTYSYGTAQ